MSDAADRRIAELEAENYRLREENDNRRKWLDRAEKMVHEAEKKLVERDVYEAEQRLPPEQAALIKHLRTVERCIEEGPVSYSYAESQECVFCGEWQTGAHLKGCEWVLMQFDRKLEATMTMVHEHALVEDEDWERRRRVTLPRSGPGNHFNRAGLAQWLTNMYGPAPSRDLLGVDALRASMAVRESREALARRGTEIHQNMADAMAYGTSHYTAGSIEHVQALMVLPKEARPVTEVAPPDDEDVP